MTEIKLTDYVIVDVQLRQCGPTEKFKCSKNKVKVGDVCIVCIDRGQDYGKVLTINTDVNSVTDLPDKQRIVRVCQSGDLKRIEHNNDDCKKQLKPCKQEIASHKLDMKLVNAEYTFDRGKLIFYFSSEKRIDFRQLVKDLAKKFKTRIELRQIGVRDEAKIIGGIGCCGRKTCCVAWIHEFSSVNIKMAKLQQMQLHPTKLSGVCGRLKCCLGYEYEAYRDLQSKMPVRGQRVRTSTKTGDVIDTSLLKQEVTVRFDDDTFDVFDVKEITVVSRSKSRAKSRALKRKAQSNKKPAPKTNNTKKM